MEIVPHPQHVQHQNGHCHRLDQRHNNTPVSAEGGAAVDGGGLLKVRRHRTDVVCEQKYRLRGRQRDTHDDEAELVVQVQRTQIFYQRNHDDLKGDEDPAQNHIIDGFEIGLVKISGNGVGRHGVEHENQPDCGDRDHRGAFEVIEIPRLLKYRFEVLTEKLVGKEKSFLRIAAGFSSL